MTSAPRYSRAFTLIEVMVVVAIIAILALLALPTYTDKIVRDQVLEGMKLADVAITGVTAKYNGDMPIDNAAAGIPQPDKIVSNYVTSVAVVEGAVNITFGNNSNALLKGKILTYRPVLVPGEPRTPLDWVCNTRPVPKNMEARGKNITDIPPQYLPVKCRGPAAQ